MKTKNGPNEATVEAFYDLIDQQCGRKETREIMKWSKKQEKFRLMCYGISFLLALVFIFWRANNPMYFSHRGLENQIDVIGTMGVILLVVTAITNICLWAASYNHESVDNLHSALPRQKMVKDFRSAWQFRNFNLSEPELIACHIDTEARSATKEIKMYEEYRKKHSTSLTKDEKRAEKRVRRYLKVLVSLASSLELMGTRYARPDNGLASTLKPLENRRAEWLYRQLFGNPDFTV